MKRRNEELIPHARLDELFVVLTIGQNGEIRARQPGKGNNPPEWRGSYFHESPGSWYIAHAGNVVFSAIDLWKGCIAVVPDEFGGGLVSKEFPIYEVTDSRLSPEFLQCLLRSRYYQRAFRAITTGHSNRRRTQTQDFEDLEIAFPPNKSDQESIIMNIENARREQRAAAEELQRAFSAFSDLVDGRGDELLPEVEDDEEFA